MKINLEIIIIVVISVLVGYYMCKGNIQENFAVTDDVKQAIGDIYKADVEAVRNLSSIAKKLQEGGVNVPGDMIFNGTVTNNNDIIAKGKVSVLGIIDMANQKKITSSGRLHIDPQERLYLLPKNDVWITKDWGASGNINISGDATINGSIINRKNHYLFYPEDAIIYQDIHEALSNGAITKSGTPNGWDQTTWKTRSYPENNSNGKKLLKIGTNNDYPNGIKINVPEGKNMIWLRVINGDRYNSFKVFKSNGVNLGVYGSGYRNLNSLAPDGGTAHNHEWHTWIMINVPEKGDYIITSNDDGHISGLALTSNPWNYAMLPAKSYHLKHNGGDDITWNSDNWQNDQLAQIPAGRVVKLFVPVVDSGKDKLLFINEHNSNWTGLQHTGIKIEDTPVERFRTTWDHPLARHLNSKIWNRFAATLVPKNLTKDKRFIKVEINMTGIGSDIYFREMGTIDLY